MDLLPNGKERLCPDTLANPCLQKFYWSIGNKAIDPEYIPTDNDKMVSAVFDPHLDEMPGAKEALARCAELFTLTPSNQEHTADLKNQGENLTR